MIRNHHFAILGLSLWIALLACLPARAGILDRFQSWVSPAPASPAAALPPGQPGASASSTAPAQAGQPAPGGQPDKTAQPAQANQPAPGGAQPQPAQAVQPVQPSQAGQPPQWTQPAQGGQPLRAPAAERAEAPLRAEVSLNPGLVYGDQLLSEDTLWRGEVLVEGVVTVAPQATLRMEPGTVVRFRRKAGGQAPLLVVQGRVVATGAKESPVLLTSTFASPAAGDWQGVMLLGTEKKNLLENCRIQGAQTALEVLFSNVTLKDLSAERSGVGMRFQDALVLMEGGGASGCDTGLSFVETESTLRNISVVGNRQGVTARKSSIYLSEGNLSGNQAAAFSADSSRVKIQGGAVLSNGSGVSLMGCEGSVTGTKLGKSREFGISLTASRMRVSGNRITANGENGMMVFDGASVVWDNAIYENAGYDLYNAGVEEFRAPGNWWGTAAPKIFDNNGRGKVLYAPLLARWPQGQ